MNKEARDFLLKLDYPFDRNKEFYPTIVFLRTPKDFKDMVANIAEEIMVDSEHFQTGDEFLVAFVKNQEEINKIITRYASRISENGKFWFISNQYALLNNENHFQTLINSQFRASSSLIPIKNDYDAKLF
jgi:translation elongation factor EF-Ts